MDQLPGMNCHLAPSDGLLPQHTNCTHHLPSTFFSFFLSFFVYRLCWQYFGLKGSSNGLKMDSSEYVRQVTLVNISVTCMFNQILSVFITLLLMLKKQIFQSKRNENTKNSVASLTSNVKGVTAHFITVRVNETVKWPCVTNMTLSEHIL